MAWAIWLGVPLAVTLIVALWTWLRGRPSRPPTTAQAMADHERFLDALATPPPERDEATPERHSSPG